jgi:hypothetical protein
MYIFRSKERYEAVLNQLRRAKDSTDQVTINPDTGTVQFSASSDEL